MSNRTDQIFFNSTTHTLVCTGNWDLAAFPHIKSALSEISWQGSAKIFIDGRKIQKMDSAGAWLIIELENTLKQHKLTSILINFPEECQALLILIKKSLSKQTKPKLAKKTSALASLGKIAVDVLRELQDYLTFIGSLSMEALRILRQPNLLRWGALANVISRAGFEALPIIALLSFMIGIVITYQMGLQLRNYGANLFIVDLLGISILREFAPLITAIMVAGRTGSAFTAQLGTMKINQEIDALTTMGVTPAELLILPKMTGLFISLPLLTMWANIFGVIGGMMMANNMLGVTWFDFFHRFYQVVHLKALMMGLGKAFVFALIIASIGCFQGMRVEGSADSIGQNTTRSVVLAIFFIIVADALFSIVFSKLKL